MKSLPFSPQCVSWISKKGSPEQLLAMYKFYFYIFHFIEYLNLQIIVLIHKHPTFIFMMVKKQKI